MLRLINLEYPETVGICIELRGFGLHVGVSFFGTTISLFQALASCYFLRQPFGHNYDGDSEDTGSGSLVWDLGLAQSDKTAALLLKLGQLGSMTRVAAALTARAVHTWHALFCQCVF